MPEKKELKLFRKKKKVNYGIISLMGGKIKNSHLDLKSNTVPLDHNPAKMNAPIHP